MPDDPYSFAHLTKAASLVRLSGVGIVLVSIAGAFAATAGWLSPGRLDADRMIDRFEAVNGEHPGFRRNHAKGVCFTGWFESSGNGARLSTAAVFWRGRMPVIGRFALAGGLPMMADGPAAVRSMALEFQSPDGDRWRTAMNDIPVFPVKDAQAFYDQLAAGKPDPRTGRPDPAAMQVFLARHPETARALALIKAQPFSSGFGNATYNSLNTLLFVDGARVARPVRWSMVPHDTFVPEPAGKPADPNYLFDALIARVKDSPVQWRLVLTVGQPGDPTDDATVPWPEGRNRIDAGVLTVMALQDEDDGACRDISFDPLVLPAGITASDDPLLSARSGAYSESFTRREGEAKPPSAVQPGTGS
ncbi:MAG: catalase family peroxidase [Proteobacteria bacterium]|nr:catalase family peroxidase [Pseudomonadota bacterium]